MPLKEIDLKNIDTYKKAMHQDLPKLTAGTRFWIYRDVELPNAAGKKEKLPSFLALVDEKAIKPLLRGKKLICKGTCALQDGKVAFDAESGVVPYRLLKRSVPLFLGKTVLIPANANEDADGGDVDIAESEAEESPSKAPEAPSATEATAAWNKLIGEVKAGLASHPDHKDALTQAAAGIPDLIKANKTAEAMQKMEHLQGLLKALPTTAPPPPPPGPPPGQGLAAAWNKLVKDLQAAVAAHPERKDALAHAAAGIPDLIKANKLDEAKQKMDQLQAMLDAATEASHPTAPVPSGAELTSRWNALVKEMQAAITAHAERKADLVRASAGIPDMIRVGKLELAKKLMDGVDAVLARPLPAVEPPVEEAESVEAEDVEGEEPEELEEPEVSDPQAEFESRFPALEELAEDALKENAGDTSGIRSILASIREKSAQGDYAYALKALDRLDTVLDQVEEEGETKSRLPYPGIVKYRTALLGFDSAKSLVDQQIVTLRQTIATILPDEQEAADEIAGRLTEWNEELADVIDEAMNMAEDENSPVNEEVRRSIDEYLAKLNEHELIQRVDGNPFTSVSIAPTLRAALLKIKEAMPAAA